MLGGEPLNSQLVLESHSSGRKSTEQATQMLRVPIRLGHTP